MPQFEYILYLYLYIIFYNTRSRYIVGGKSNILETFSSCSKPNAYLKYVV